MATKDNKPSRSDRSRKMISGTQKHLASASAIVISGASYTPAAIEKVFQGSIDAADATATATATFHKATAAERDANKSSDALYRGMRTYLTNQYALQPDVLADFGIEIATRQAPDATTVAAAVAKRADTRAARHTMGKRQKAAVTGTSAAKGTTTAPGTATGAPTTPATAAPATTPKAS
ncbi:MAG: hypothetical protein ACRENE_20535 [Polyangiaceae bacterium]